MVRLFLLLFFASSLYVYSQKIVVLEIWKAGAVRQVNYYCGDHVTLRISGQRKSISGRITAIGDSAFLVQNAKRTDTVSVKDISIMYRERGDRLADVFAQTFISCGIFLVGLDAVQSHVNHSDEFVHGSVLIVSGALIGTGVIIKLFEKRKYRIGKNYQVKIVELSPYRTHQGR